MKLSLSAASLRLVSNTTVCVLLVLMCCCRCCWCLRGRPVTRDSLTSGADSTDISHTRTHTHTPTHATCVCVCVCVAIIVCCVVLKGLMKNVVVWSQSVFLVRAHTHTHTHTFIYSHIYTHTHINSNLTHQLISLHDDKIQVKCCSPQNSMKVCVCVCVCRLSSQPAVFSDVWLTSSGRSEYYRYFRISVSWETFHSLTSETSRCFSPKPQNIFTLLT